MLLEIERILLYFSVNIKKSSPMERSPWAFKINKQKSSSPRPTNRKHISPPTALGGASKDILPQGPKLRQLQLNLQLTTLK